MDQFEIHPIIPFEIGGVDVSFTNSSLWMCIVVASISLFLTLSASSRTVVPTRLQSVAEISYDFIANMIRSTAGNDGLRFFPFIYPLFMFVLFSNLFGLLPLGLLHIHPFTVTSHIIVTFALAMTVFTMVIVVGILRNGFGFLRIFAPSVPWYMLILLIPIEIVSFLSRPISLSIRLFANMLVGHVLLYVLGTFVVGLIAAGGILTVMSALPMAAIVAISGLEFLIAFLQAYVFAILTCIYLNDVLHIHH